MEFCVSWGVSHLCLVFYIKNTEIPLHLNSLELDWTAYLTMLVHSMGGGSRHMPPRNVTRKTSFMRHNLINHYILLSHLYVTVCSKILWSVDLLVYMKQNSLSETITTNSINSTLSGDEKICCRKK